MDKLKVTRKVLMEATRSQLINKSKKGDSYALSNQHKGKNRWERRKYSKVATTISSYNSIDLNTFFKGDMLEFTIPVQGETNNYSVVIVFEKILEEIREQVKRNNNKLEYKCILRALLRVFNSDNVYVSCSCLHPDTKIKLLDGSNPTVKEMKERFDNGEKLYVYSADEKGDFKPGEVEKVWITKTTTNFIKITLDNGEILITTPDHLYMLRDGSYKQAQELEEGQSLMPLYTSNSNGYETIKFNSEVRGWHTTYKEVANYFKIKEIEEARLRSSNDDNMPYEVAIHHIDFNKLNNNPENLLPMTAREHWDYHANNMSTKWQQPEFKEKMAKMFKSEAFSESMKHRFDNETPEHREARLTKVANSNKGKHFGKQSEATCKLKSERRRGISPGPMKEETKQKISQSQKQRWENLSDEEKDYLNKQRALTPEQYATMVKAVREYHKNNPVTDEHRKHMSEARKGVPLGPNSEIAKQHKKEAALKIKDKTGQRAQEYWKNLTEEEKEIHTKNMCYSRIQRVLQILVDNNVELTSDNYYIYRPRYGTVRWENYFDTFNDVIQYFNLNHKIAKIEYITLEDTPVYDIAVKDWHNFATTAGVYLHNCPDFKFSFQFWSTRNQYNSGTPQSSNGKGIRNPNDTKGAACKHVNLCLANLDWMMKIASVINNYIWYCKDNMENNYAQYIFPAIYGMPYDKAVQLTFDNFDDKGNLITDPELATDIATINLANALGKRRTQFKKAPEKSVNPRYVPPKKEQPISDKIGLNMDKEGEANESLNEEIKDGKLIVYRVGQTDDFKQGLFFADTLDYYDYSDTGYSREDAEAYELDLTNAKVFDPMKDWDLSVNTWSDIRQSEEFFKEHNYPYYEYLDGVNYDDPDEYHEVMTDTDSLAQWAYEDKYDVVILRDIPGDGGRSSNQTEYCIFNRDIIKKTDLDDDLLEKIVKLSNGKWQVQSEKGRNLGTYDTRDEAEKRLNQVEYFKHLNEDIQTTDNEGNPLSKEQIEFFKNSKVRDEQGRLIVCYHGTDNDFDEFDISKSGKNGANFFGKGHYFTISSNNEYGKVQKKCYLNITNPMLGGKSWIDYCKKNGREWYQYPDLTKQLKEDSYDGIIIKDNDTIVAFYPNQIKSIDNKNPTRSNNINEYIETNNFEPYTAGYIKENGSLIILDEYHGEEPELTKHKYPEFSNTHFEEDTAVRVYRKKPTNAQLNRIEQIIDYYLDNEGYCKLSLFKQGEKPYYKAFEIQEDSCQDPYVPKLVGNWTGYKLVRIIKNYFNNSKELKEGIPSDSLETKFYRWQAGGEDFNKIFSDDDIQYMKKNTTTSRTPIYRCEELTDTNRDLQVGDIITYDRLKSFSRDKDGFYDVMFMWDDSFKDIVCFKTTGSVTFFDCDKAFNLGYDKLTKDDFGKTLNTQKEVFAEGKFKIVKKEQVYDDYNDSYHPLYIIKQLKTKDMKEALYPALQAKGFRFSESPVKGASYLMPNGFFLGMEENKDIIGNMNGKTTHPDLDFWLVDNGLVPLEGEASRTLVKSDNAIRLNDGTNFINETATVSLPPNPLSPSQIKQLQNWLVDVIYLIGAKRIDVGDETTDNFKSFDIDLNMEDSITDIMNFIQNR